MITTRNHLTMQELEASLDYLRESPKDNGVLEMIVIRPHVETREVISEGQLDDEFGLVGDNWSRRGSRKHGQLPDPDMQLNIMNSRVVGLVAQEKERWQLAGDQFFLNMDLSKANLPVGARLAIGSAVIEVTAPPHLGCHKFVSRFGLDAMKFVNSPVGKELCLRGINARVVQAGIVRVGDRARKL